MQLRCGALATEAACYADKETSLKVVTFPVPDSRQAESFYNLGMAPTCNTLN